MGVQLTYKTKQRDLLLEYLEANPETSVNTLKARMWQSVRQRSTGIWNGW